jgi:hypothetical protein
MIVSSKDEFVQKIVSLFVQRFDIHVDDDRLLSCLRDIGIGKVETIKLLSECSGLPINQLKVIVHNSQTWRDRHEADHGLHEIVDTALKNK